MKCCNISSNLPGFDFPSAYVARNQIAKLKGFDYESQGAEVRQQILLQAKQLCLEIIYLRQQQASLNERLSNTKRLATVYAEKLEAGTANILETNKINVELITTQTAVDLNATSLTMRPSKPSIWNKIPNCNAWRMSTVRIKKALH